MRRESKRTVRRRGEKQGTVRKKRKAQHGKIQGSKEEREREGKVKEEKEERIKGKRKEGRTTK